VAKNRILIIGLDGGTFDLLSPLMDEGYMPILKALVQRGAHCRLNSTIPPVTPSAWTSFQTGTNPGKHGLVEFLYPQHDYRLALVNSRDVATKSLWTLLGEAGKQVLVINVPLTYPPYPVQGYMVSGMMAPDTSAQFTYPPDLARDLLEKVPGYQITPLNALAYLGLHHFVDELCRITEKRAEAALYLMDKADWDCAMVHFQATDVIQHALWSHLDARDPRFAQIAAADRQRARDFYREVDSQVGRVITAAGEGATVIVMSDHGFGSAYQRLYINQWLAENGYLALTVWPPLLKALGVMEDALRRADVLKLRRRIVPAFAQRDQLLRGLAQDPLIDWARTEAFAFTGTTYANIYLNREGRFDRGKVPGGRRAEDLSASIAESLLSWCDPSSRQPLIERVYRREEIYRGPQVERLPDLIVQPRAGYTFETRFKRGWLIGPMPADLTGSHRVDGVFVGAGPRFRPEFEGEAASLLDVGPTILSLLGVPIPDHTDGRILAEFLEPAPVPAQAEAARGTSMASGNAAGEESPYSEEESQAILEHLRSLGYL
jgi:predicted AlkP superfamily phosphohydrolase/phosphomutase